MKLGIAFEGGASRTYFTCGVMNALINNNIKADIVVGSSAGIANGVSYSAWQPDRCEEILHKYYSSPEYMGFKYLFKKGVRSLYNIPFVFDKIPNELVPFDYDTFKNGGIKSVATVTNIRTAKTEYLTLTGDDKSWTELIATCALPILFPPVTINGEEYMDGGITDSVPVDYLIREGCDRIIVVLTQERQYRKGEPDIGIKLSARKYRHYPEFAKALMNRNDNYNKAREHIFELEKQGRIFIIAPEVMRGISRTETDVTKLQQIYNHGIEVTNALMGNMKTYLEDKQL